MSALQPLQTWWQGLASRERWAIGAAGSVVVAALVWVLMIQPPLQLLRQSAHLHAKADAALAHMQGLASLAQQHRAGARIGTDDAIKALDTLVKAQLGSGSGLTVVGDQATVTLRNVPAGQLVDFLRDARTQARALPSQVQLTRPNAANAPVGTVLWDGKMVLSLHSMSQ
jgi:general secretion pathway protein M